jgi:hypothetical protein
MNSCRSVFVDKRVAKTAVAPRFVHLTLNLSFLLRRQLFHISLKVDVVFKKRPENFLHEGISLYSVSVRGFVEMAVLLDCKSCRLLQRQADTFDGVNDGELFKSGHVALLGVGFSYVPRLRIVAFTIVTILIATRKKLTPLSARLSRAASAHSSGRLRERQHPQAAARRLVFRRASRCATPAHTYEAAGGLLRALNVRSPALHAHRFDYKTGPFVRSSRNRTKHGSSLLHIIDVQRTSTPF